MQRYANARAEFIRLRPTLRTEFFRKTTGDPAQCYASGIPFGSAASGGKQADIAMFNVRYTIACIMLDTQPAEDPEEASKHEVAMDEYNAWLSDQEAQQEYKQYQQDHEAWKALSKEQRSKAKEPEVPASAKKQPDKYHVSKAQRAVLNNSSAHFRLVTLPDDIADLVVKVMTDCQEDWIQPRPARRFKEEKPVEYMDRLNKGLNMLYLRVPRCNYWGT